MANLRYGSVCSGIEAASVAWELLGWESAWFAEIEAFPSAVLGHRYPSVPNLGDITSPDFIEGTKRSPPVDILIGGTPCQSFSVAGLRRGLGDERGNLTLRFVEIMYGLDPAVTLWENVPGILSSKDNAFGCFLGALVGADEPLLPPKGRKWTYAGLVSGPEGRAVWRILNAQYFGVPQRRRRVFVVRCPHGGADPQEILFESQGLHRNPSSRREERKEVARNVGESPQGRSPVYRVHEEHSSAMTSKGSARVADPVETLWALDTNGGYATNQGGNIVLESIPLSGVEPPLTHNPYGDHESREGLLIPEISYCLNGHGGSHGRLDGESQTFVPVMVNARENPISSGNVSLPLGSKDRGHAICLQGSQIGRLEANGPLGAGHNEELAFNVNANDQHAVAFTQNQVGDVLTSDISYSMGTNQNATGRNTPKVVSSLQVRRLTPCEYERLQGFPDEWTRIPWRGKPEDKCPDGPRYKAVGNSMAVPVIRWIGRRIELALSRWELEEQGA